MFDDGAAYERFMGRWSDLVAVKFLGDLEAAPGLHWLDVGSGSGALLAAVQQHCQPTACTAVDPSEAQLIQARERLGPEVRLVTASAESLPLLDGEVDVTTSALALNFCIDPRRALNEMLRVTRRSGTVAGYVWDYAHPGFFLQAFWEAAAATAASDGDERSRWPMCSPAGMADLLAPFGTSTVWPIQVRTSFASFDELWGSFELGVGPAGAHLAALDPPRAGALRKELARTIEARGGPTELSARAVAFRVAA